MALISRSHVYLLAVCFAVVAPTPANAALVLDDFDGPSETASPEMVGNSVVVENIGELSSSRTLRIASSAGPATPSISSLDSDVSAQSILTADLTTPGVHLRGGPVLFAFQFGYSFAPSDISQEGTNSAIFFDFQSLAGNGFVPELGVLVWDNTDLSESYFAAVNDLPLSSGPVSISIPFSSFTQRGGSPGLPDFTTVRRIDFDFFFQFPPSDAQWSAEIERIRFGRVPEPSSQVMMIFVACLALRWRK